MEIIIQKLETGTIEFNYDDIKKYLTERLETYQGLVYTEETISDAKGDRANLNKLKKAIDDKRKDIKKECLKPYDEFELKIKDLLALIDKPVNEIDEQIKGYESALKEDKFIKIIEIYNKYIGDLKDILPLAKIQDDKWLNLTVKIKDIEVAIKEIINKVTTDLQVINEFDTEFKFEIKNKYLDTLDLSKALSEKTKLEERKKNLDELKRKEDEQKDEIPDFILEPIIDSMWQEIEKEAVNKPNNLQILETFWSSNGGNAGLIIAKDTITKEIKTYFGCANTGDVETDINYICSLGQKLEESTMKSILKQYFS